MVFFHPRQIQTAIVEWLDERYAFTESVNRELYRRVPNYATAFQYYLGVLVFVLIVLEFISGFLLGLYYVPDASGNPAPAYTSVDFIQRNVYLGWLIRGVHFWGAHLLIALVLLHLIRVYWTGSYRAPRELNWMVGVGMLLLILILAITGELLPWDSKTYLARSRELSIVSGGSALPTQLSAFIKYVLQGGPTVGAATLQRFFMAHVFLLPGLITFLMYLHFRFVRKQGPAPPVVGTKPQMAELSRRTRAAISPSTQESAAPIELVDADLTSANGIPNLEPASKRLPIGPKHVLYPMVAGIAMFGMLMGPTSHHLAEDMPDDETHPFFPDHFWPYPIITAAMLILLGLLAVFEQKNLQLDVPADPRAIAIPRPDWYFLFLFQFLKLGPELLMSLAVPLLAVLALLFWPFIDSGVGPRLARRLGWKEWPVPCRNAITGSLLVGVVGFLALLTIWALAGPRLCVPWPINGPVCGG